MRAHPVRLGAHRQGQATGAGQFGIVALFEDRLAGLGAPDQPVEQVEPIGVVRLDHLGGEGDQGAGHAEAAGALGIWGLGQRFAGCADRPGEGFGGRAGEHVAVRQPSQSVSRASTMRGMASGTLCQHLIRIETDFAIRLSWRVARLDRVAPGMSAPSLIFGRSRLIVPGKV
jgi:hypothetical protein